MGSVCRVREGWEVKERRKKEWKNDKKSNERKKQEKRLEEVRREQNVYSSRGVL